jgi:hypothetical protein
MMLRLGFERTPSSLDVTSDPNPAQRVDATTRRRDDMIRISDNPARPRQAPPRATK